MSIFAVKEISEIEQGPVELIYRVDKVLKGNDPGYWTFIQYNHQDINLSDVYSELINLAGRYCTSYASDLLYELQTVAAFTEPCVIDKPSRWVIGFGFRERGVDGRDVLPYRIGHSNYKSIVALNIEDKKDERFGWVREYKLVQID